MTSPDVAAATYAPEWRGRPIPAPGDHITMVALIRTEANHFLHKIDVEGVVNRAEICSATPGLTTELVVTLVDDPLEYRLRALNPSCDWALRSSARHDLVAPPPLESPSAEDPLSIVALERRLLAVQNRLKAISGEEDALKDEAATLAQQIRDAALEQEMETLPGVDGMTAYFAPVHYVEYKIDESTGKKFTAADVREALEQCGHGYLIAPAYNGNQLRALIREIKVEHKQPLPAPLAAVLNLETRYDVRFTPMGEHKRRSAPQRDI